jgi:hypothetical protein
VVGVALMPNPDDQEREAVVNGDKKAERALRRVVTKLAGPGPGQWTFDGHLISDEIAKPLLVLTDELNHLDRRWMG